MQKSEELFEQWARFNGWVTERIVEETEQTPDYRLTIGSTLIYAEVKEIVANDEEKKAIQQLETDGIAGPLGEEPGLTVRRKIKSSYGQIKRLAEQPGLSGILVLYDNTGLVGSGRLDSYHVLTGMFGLQTVRVSIPEDVNARPIFGPDFLGPRKSVSDTRYRYLSGIVVLCEHHDRGLVGYVYHNPHALFPLDYHEFGSPNCTQFRVNFQTVSWDLLEQVHN